MKFVCPVPMKWSEIYKSLINAYEASELNCPPPPMPLILGGWIYSGDEEKNHRWNSTIHWAEKFGFGYLIPNLDLEDMHMVEEYGYPNIDFRGLNWDMTVKEKPDLSRTEEYLDTLKNRWGEIAGPSMSGITFPNKFTGRKKRRLLVFASQNHKPPWGEWNRIITGHGAVEFREFRKRINEFINPHAVDHVDFEEVIKKNFHKEE